MKRTLFTLCLCSAALNARGVLPVIDSAQVAQTQAQIALNQQNEVTNLAHWISTEAHTLNTELNTLHQYETEVLQLARFGDPGALKNLPGIGSIAQLCGSGQQLLQTYQRIQSVANPGNLQFSLGSVQSAYSLQRWNPLSPVAYQFPAASYSVSQTVQDQMTALEKERQTLEQQRDQALQSLASATTASDVAKYHAVITGLNGGLAEVAAREQALAQKSQLQQQQLNAGAQVQRLQATEQVVAGYNSDVNSSISTLDSLATGAGTLPHWPQ